PFGLSRPYPVLARTAPLPHDRGQGPGRPPSRQPASLAGLFRRTRHACGRLLRAVGGNMSYAVSVRTLCEFAARRGDLDLRFHLGPSAQEGMLGHRIVTARRADHYLKEIPLQAQHGALTVRGRADGFDPESRRLEEIK